MVLINENTNVLEDKLERWWGALEKNGLKTRRAKTKFLKFSFNNMVGGNESDRNVKLKGKLYNKKEKFKYLGSIVQNNEELWMIYVIELNVAE